MKISASAFLAILVFATVGRAQWRADPKGEFVTLQGVIKEKGICLSVSPKDKSTYFGVGQEQWELNLLKSDKDSYTFQVRYLVDDKIIESIERSVTRGKTVDFEIPKGQIFQSFFSSSPPK